MAAVAPGPPAAARGYGAASAFSMAAVSDGSAGVTLPPSAAITAPRLSTHRVKGHQ